MSEFYIVEEVKEMGWEPDQWNNVVYGIKLNGVLDGALLRAQARPEVGDKLFGHFEQTKTGKGQWFKKDRIPDETKDINPKYDHSQLDVPSQGVAKTANQLDRLEEKVDNLTAMVADLAAKLTGDVEMPAEMPEDFLI